MITGLNLEETIDYTIKNDLENPTVWKLGIIPSYIFARISADASSKEIETAYRILQVAIKGWDNFNIPFETVQEKIYGRDLTVVSLSVLERIPLNVITELSMKVMEINQISPEERKN